jgi:polyribonucleotide nucleotidyltransferase
VPVVGDEYEAVVKSIMPYGAFVEFLPGKQGLLHISEVSWKRLETLEGVLNENDKVKVKLTGTDPKTGKFKLSRKVLLPKPEGMKEDSGDRGDRREGGQRFEGRGDRREGGYGGGQRREPRPQQGGENQQPQGAEENEQ